MLDRGRSLLLRLFKVPAEPTPPAGDPRSIRIFRAAPNHFYSRLPAWLLTQIGAFVALFVSTIDWADLPDGFAALGRLFDIVAWPIFIAQLFVSLLALRLDHELRWYILSDRALRIREGLFSIQEKTMAYANIQQISVRRGPLQRLLGIADIEVRTAGGGSANPQKKSSAGDMHRGFFRGVADAETVRDLIRQRVREYRSSGLGDPEEKAQGRSVAATPGAAAADVAHDLLREVQALRDLLAPAP